MIARLRARPWWIFFGVLPKASSALAIAWWIVLLLRGVLPALFAIATTYEDYLNGKMPTARLKAPAKTFVVTYDTDALALQDLALGNGVRLDGALTALPTIRNAIAGGLPLRVLEPPVFEDSSAIALDRQSPIYSAPLLWAVDDIVHEMHRDGTLRRLSLKYYGIDLTVRR